MTTDRKLAILEVATVLAIAGLALWSVRPLVEEWGTLNDFNQLGPFYPWDAMLRYMALRPLHMTGYLLQWVAGGGKPIGVTIVASVVMVARYAIVRWAVTPFVSPVERWLIATFAAVLFIWPSVWFGRFIGAQLSTLLFFAALGYSLRLTRGWSAHRAVLGVLCGFALLLTYQALALAMLAAIFVVTGARAEKAGGDSSGARGRSFFNGAVPFAGAILAYAAYLLILRTSGFTGSYEGDGAQYQPPLVSFVALRIEAVFASAFYQNPMVAPLLLATAFAYMLLGAAGRSAGAFQARIALFVLALPVLGLTFLVLYHARDFERTLFTVSVGFVLLLLHIALCRGRAGLPRLGLTTATALVAVCLGQSALFAAKARELWDLQDSVLTRVLALTKDSPGDVLVKDETGQLGDLYRFLTHTNGDGSLFSYLTPALHVSGRPGIAIICTPLGVDRVHRDRPTTSRCEDVSQPFAHVFRARERNGGIVLGPEPTRRVQRGRPVRFDDSGAGDLIIAEGWSGQEGEMRWSEGPMASLALDLAEDGADTAELVLTLDPFLGGGLAAQRVTVVIDGIEAGTWQVDRPNDYSVAIPPEAMRDGHLSVVLSISDPTAPCTVSGSADCRELGVAIHRLMVN